MFLVYEKDNGKIIHIMDERPYAISGNLSVAVVAEVPDYNLGVGDYLTYKNGEIIYNENPNKAKLRAEIEIAELKGKLTDTDYKAIKYAEGVLTAEEYAEIKAQRQVWRERINELEEVVK